MATQPIEPAAEELPAPPPDDARLVTWALWCAEVGRLTGAWKVFPCVASEKRPLHKGWQDEAASDRKTVECMWRNDPKANIGLAIQPRFVAIDTDIYKPGAEAALDAFEAEHGELPRTLENGTARGGYHLIYSTTKTFGNGKGTLPDFGDVRGHGGLIVGPGSVFEGKRYTVENLSPPVALPEHIEGMLREGKRRDPSEPDDPVPGVTVDDQRNIQYFADWCAGKSVRTTATPKGKVASACIEGQGGNNTLAATGAMAHDYGLSADVGYATALEHHNPRCEPPWDDDEYEYHFRSGYNSASSPLGYRAPGRDYSHLFKPYLATDNGELVDDIASQPVSDPERDVEADRQSEPSSSGKEVTVAGFRIADREALEHVRPPEWIIEDFIPDEAYAMVFGAYSTFKTFLALDMALTVACENDLNTTLWTPEVRGPVLFMAGEGRSSIAKRIKAWERVHNEGRAVEDFVLVDPVPLINITEEKLSALLGSALERHPGGYFLTVIDTIGRSMVGADENSQQGASAFTALVQRLREELGGSVLALHHTGHQEGKRARGSSVFGADPDTLVRIDRAANSRVVSLTMTKQKDAPEWEMKKHMKLNEVHLSLEITSLVAVKLAENECPKGDKFHPTGGEREALMAVLNDAVIARLKCDKSKEWSQIALADAVATDERIEIGSSQLRQRHLKDLRKDSSQPASRFYNAGKGKWRYGED